MATTPSVLAEDDDTITVKIGLLEMQIDKCCVGSMRLDPWEEIKRLRAHILALEKG